MTDSIRHEALEDCKYAFTLDAGSGTFTALNEHFEKWFDPTGMGDLDYAYHSVIMEIKNKFGTDQCLLSGDSK